MRRKGKHAKKLMCIHELCVFACVFISVCLCRSWSNLRTWQSMDVCRVYLNTYVISLTYADRARKAMCSTYLCMFLSCDLCSFVHAFYCLLVSFGLVVGLVLLCTQRYAHILTAEHNKHTHYMILCRSIRNPINGSYKQMDLM